MGTAIILTLVLVLLATAKGASIPISGGGDDVDAVAAVSVGTGEGCVLTCYELDDNVYQSCKTCTSYIVCTGQKIFAIFHCPAGTVWDDNSKACDQQSSTCTALGEGNVGGTERPTVPPSVRPSYVPTVRSTFIPTTRHTTYPTFIPTTRPQATTPDLSQDTVGCTWNCDGITEGVYQSCEGCEKFKICLGGVEVSQHTCPFNYQWDNIKQKCVVHSYTCTHKGTPPPTTPGAPSGTSRPPVGTTWPPFRTTRGPIYTTSTRLPMQTTWPPWQTTKLPPMQTTWPPWHTTKIPPMQTTWPPWHTTRRPPMQTTRSPWITTRGPTYTPTYVPTYVPTTQQPMGNSGCTWNCSRLVDGLYQSCKACSFYLECQTQRIISVHTCTGNLEWDHREQQCVPQSQTCDYHEPPGGTISPFLELVGAVTTRPPTAPPSTRPNDPTSRLYVETTRPEFHTTRGYQGTTRPYRHTTRGYEGTTRGYEGTTRGYEGTTRVPTTLPHVTTPDPSLDPVGCTDDCTGVDKGVFQVCGECGKFAICKYQELVGVHTCPFDYQWDNIRQKCVEHSFTCTDAPKSADFAFWRPWGKKKTTTARTVQTTRATPTRRPSTTKRPRTTKKPKTTKRPTTTRRPGRFMLTGNTLLPSTRPETTRPTHTSTASEASTTDHMSSTIAHSTIAPNAKCIWSCKDKPDGSYQSCKGCQFYSKCEHGDSMGTYVCLPGKAWDEVAKSCVETSATCRDTGSTTGITIIPTGTGNPTSPTSERETSTRKTTQGV